MDVTKRILLVDDEPNFRFSASVALRKAGFEVVEAGGGAEALERLLECRAAGEPVSVVVTDIRMPGMSGLELVDEMKRRGIDTPVFFITGVGGNGLAADLAARGCAELLEKPFEPEEMVARLSLFTNRIARESPDGTGGGSMGRNDKETRHRTFPGKGEKPMRNKLFAMATVLLLGAGGALSASAQESSIHIQCPQATGTLLHPTPGDPAIKCDHLMAGDGAVTMADDSQKLQYIFSFSRVPLPGEGGAPLYPAYPGYVMEQGMLAANAPGPTIVADENDEVYLNLTNVGMMLRPDLFDPHTVHWHGFPQASSVFDGVPDASISINMGATLTYYYQPKDPGTYMYHCHVEATEHMQMGMLANLYVRPRQNRLPGGTVLGTHVHSNPDYNPVPGFDDPLVGDKYAYNDGDGSTRYDVEYPVQMGSFDPDFHDASYNVQPLPFAGMRDRYFMLNGRGYPDTVNNTVLSTFEPVSGLTHASQRIDSLITANAGQRILLRISNLSVTRFYTLATNGIPVEVVGLDARLLRDDDGNNLYYKTNSVTLGGGQSADVILDTTGLAPGSTYFLYSTNLDTLSNDAENFGGMMTEIRINL